IPRAAAPREPRTHRVRRRYGQRGPGIPCGSVAWRRSIVRDSVGRFYLPGRASVFILFRRPPMKRSVVFLLLALSIPALVSFDAGAGSPPSYPVVTGKAYRFEQIAEGVYYATATGSMVTGSN